MMIYIIKTGYGAASNGGAKIMHFVLNTRNYTSKTRSFVSKTRNYTSKTRSFVSKTRNCVFQRMDFAGPVAIDDTVIADFCKASST